MMYLKFRLKVGILLLSLVAFLFMRENVNAQSYGKKRFSSSYVTETSLDSRLIVASREAALRSNQPVITSYARNSPYFINMDPSDDLVKWDEISVDAVGVESKSPIQAKDLALELLSGYFGGFLFGFGASAIANCGWDCSSDGIEIYLMNFFTGYTVGSAFGVYFVGSKGKIDKWSIFATLVGSSVAMWTAFQIERDFLKNPSPILILPPIGATIAFNLFKLHK